MSGRHVRSSTGGRARILLAASGVAFVAVLVALFVPTGAASAAGTPTPNYTPGTDTATFTVAGVLDQNCLVSTGGTELWIKPGDAIDFKSSLVGISVGNAVAGQTLGGLLNSLLQPGQVAGLDVSATIYSGNSAQTVTVAGGQTTSFPSSGQNALSAGDHKITWDATGLALLPGLQKTSIPLSSAALQSGADLSWTGVIHVTKSAPQCKLSVSTPQAKISLGPVHVTIPPVNASVPGVTLPTSLPSVPDLNPGGAGTTPTTAPTATTAGSAPTTGMTFAPPALTVPQMAVPGGDGSVAGNSGSGSGGGGGFRLGVSGTDTNGQLSVDSGSGSGSNGGSSSGGQSSGGSGSTKTVDLASSASSPSGQLPVLLAILAVITLAVVAGLYSRLYLLGRKSTPSA